MVAGTSFAGWLGDGNTPPIHQYHESADITVLKLDDDGHYIWHTFYGSDTYEDSAGLALDLIGNVMIAGFGDASWQGDGGANPLHPYTGGYDLIVVKLAGWQYFLPLLQR